MFIPGRKKWYALFFFINTAHAVSTLPPPNSVQDVLSSKFLRSNAGALTITGSGNLQHMEILFSDRATCDATTAPTTAYTMAMPIINATPTPFSSGITYTFNPSSIYRLITATLPLNSAPTSTQCMQVYLTDNSTKGLSCLSYILQCDGTTQTCTSTNTYTANWISNPTSCVPFLTGNSSSRGIINQGLTNRTYYAGTSLFGGLAFQSENTWLAASSSTNESGIYRSNNAGRSWTNTPIGTTSTIQSVSCTGKNCIAVGVGGVLRLSKNTGRDWTAPNSSPTSNNLRSVSCNGTLCVAVGSSGTIIRSSNSGETWSLVTTSTTSTNLNGLSCATKSACVAVGASATILYTTNGGATWSTSTGTQSVTYNSVSCMGTSCIAVGSQSSTPKVSYSNNSGQSWASANTLPTTGALQDVSCTPTYCVATSSTSPNIIRSTNWNSGFAPTWSATTTTNLGTGPMNAIRCTGTTCVVSSNNAGVMGYSIDSGQNWNAVTNSVGLKAINDTSCTGSICLAAGNSSGQTGTIARSTDRGTTWSLISSVTDDMNGITCDASRCIAVGPSGKIIRSTSPDGSTWEARTSGVSVTLNKVACDNTICLAVGNPISNKPLIDRSVNNGLTWNSMSLNTGGNVNLNNISCSNPLCVAVGDSGRALYSSDASHGTWTLGASNTGNALNGVSCFTSQACVAVGSNGLIIKTTDGGLNWSSKTSSITTPLTSVKCTGTICLAAGDSDVVLISTNLGDTWKPLLPKMFNVTLAGVGVF